MKEKTAKRILRKLGKKIVLGFNMTKNEKKNVSLATTTLLKGK
jgi:hypothetical protein